jgi:hypothetical protein
MKPAIVRSHPSDATPDRDIPTVLLDLGGPAPSRRQSEFFMIKRPGMVAMGAAVEWHGPAMLAVLEAVRLATMGRTDGLRLSWAWAKEAGISRRQLRTIRQTLATATEWVTVTVDGRSASIVRPTKAARAALEYRRN